MPAVPATGTTTSAGGPASRLLALRLAGLALVLVIVQIAFVSQLSAAGGVPDLAPLAVMAVGLLVGSLPGALFGFCLGFLIDVALLQTLGISSLILLGVGYWCGRLGESRDTTNLLAPLALGAAATLASSVLYSFLQFLLDVDAPVSGALARQLLATLILNTLLAVPVFGLVRRWLGASVPEDPRRRRRRARTVGLSPLQSPSQGALTR